ncbi:beta-1,4-galactosyltransferase 3-like [Corvus hawaiiensis]|uniref:Beta-1,4-galactosyltransferase n=2 Tax=Corvus moneduloides TaxID=1196302 RepID=A0A8C3EAL3_CORMO|nr:PREDICTED: beta-1,4-galactosyltransferase 3-like [Corvus brachyrhynchos]XP_031954389.1 beta-1,4-galactosyltransferase 3-like [Corvus moneduloides]XP_048149893.1 beta-1,4-galactosyltransferase 3-like [Corvus hawaiiensis]
MILSRVENHCFLLFVFVFQAIFILILYRGGPSNVFRGFLESPQGADYSKPHDVYTNLSLFTRAPSEDTMPYCSAQSPVLVGPLTITFRVLPSERVIMKRNPFVQPGGHYRPPHCFPRYKSAILVAYRNQEKYLRHLLYYIHPFLQRQQLSYTIYLIQQVGTGSFNRAKLLNVGVREAMKDEEWDCLVLHDVDLVPENDYNLYICDEYYPKHMASAMDKFQYTLPYKSFFGGVSALTPEHYMKMNGFPNTYWGDSGENDDIATRIHLAGMKIVRTSPHLGRYRVMDYNEETERQEPWRRPPSRHNTRKTWKADGMNTLQFRLLSRTKHPLYTKITVDIGYVPPFS